MSYMLLTCKFYDGYYLMYLLHDIVFSVQLYVHVNLFMKLKVVRT